MKRKRRRRMKKKRKKLRKRRKTRKKTKTRQVKKTNKFSFIKGHIQQTFVYLCKKTLNYKNAIR